MHNMIHIPAHGPAPRRALLRTFVVGAALAAVACGTVLEPTAVPASQPDNVAPTTTLAATVVPASQPDNVALTTTLAATVVPPPDPNAPPDTPTPQPPAVSVPTNTPGPTPTGIPDFDPYDYVVSNDGATPAPPPKLTTDGTPTPTAPVPIEPTEPDPPTVPVQEPEPVEIPSGALALFYRTSFGSDTELITKDYFVYADSSDTRLADITWDTSSKGIIRYIPALDRYDVMKAVRSTSYSKSSLYPITANGRLFIIRDWGSDWNGKNNRFDIDEMDPVTGVTLSSNDIHAEWFAISGDQIYYKSEVKYDLFGNPSGGGRLMVTTLGSIETEEIARTADFFRAVEGGLISFTSDEVRLHDPATGSPTAIAAMDPELAEKVWPYAQQVFTGDSAIYWAVQNAPLTADIVSLAPNGAVSPVLSLEFDPEDVGIAVDEHDGLIMVAGVTSSNSRGLAIDTVFIIDSATGDIEEIPINTFIPTARAAAGGGLQILTLP